MKDSTDEYAIIADGIYKSFGKVKVLEGLNLKVKRGSILALLGPNGAGKTTTVRMLTTLMDIDAGSATIEGYDVVKDADKVRSIIGLTGQYAAVDEYLTGRENLKMMGRLYHLSKADTARRCEELLQQFDLIDAADRAAKTYSGGMRRRLDLAVSLIAAPPIIFLDEPTTGLDPRSRIAMWDIIKSLVNGGSTILLTTQYLEEADQLADRIAVIDNGHVIAEGTANQLKEQVGKERIELTFASDTIFAKAQKALVAETTKEDADRRTISIANDTGVKKLKSLLETLEKANVSVDSLSLHKPTLDDVFLQLTGHEASVSATEDTDKKEKK
jgi:ABC-2 type transport system ATP-binding protein